MKIALSSARNKLGLIDGFINEPSHEDRSWECANDMVISWLLNSMENDIEYSLLYYYSAKELWEN